MTEATTLPLRNPRTGHSDGELPITSAAEVAVLGAGLRKAQLGWAECSIEQRCARLNALADALVARRDGFLDALLADTGRWHESQIEVDGTVGAIRRWAQQAESARAPARRDRGPDRGAGRVSRSRRCYAWTGSRPAGAPLRSPCRRASGWRVMHRTGHPA